MQFRLASTNAHKLSEFAQILAPTGIRITGIDDIKDYAVIEDGATFADNAAKKAQTLYNLVKQPVLADDSGLQVDALNGAPGVHSARYAGVDTGPDQDAANRKKLLQALGDTPAEQRTAQFVCAIAWLHPGHETRMFIGTMPGHISMHERGTGGFGYDSIFIPEGYDVTAAELTAAAKNSISHRGKALSQCVAAIKQWRLTTHSPA